MNLDELQEALANLDAIPPAATKHPAIAETKKKLRKQMLGKGKKQIEDDLILDGLVDLIEIHGLSQKQAFKAFNVKGLSESRARKLWFDTVKDHPAKIEVLRQHHARHLLSDLLIWLNSDQAEKFPLTSIVLRLKNREPALFDWAEKIAVLDFHGVDHEEFKPQYKKPDDLVDIDLIAFQKEIASSR